MESKVRPIIFLVVLLTCCALLLVIFFTTNAFANCGHCGIGKEKIVLKEDPSSDSEEDGSEEGESSNDSEDDFERDYQQHVQDKQAYQQRWYNVLDRHVQNYPTGALVDKEQIKGAVNEHVKPRMDADYGRMDKRFEHDHTVKKIVDGMIDKAVEEGAKGEKDIDNSSSSSSDPSDVSSPPDPNNSDGGNKEPDNDPNKMTPSDLEQWDKESRKEIDEDKIYNDDIKDYEKTVDDEFGKLEGQYSKNYGAKIVLKESITKDFAKGIAHDVINNAANIKDFKMHQKALHEHYDGEVDRIVQNPNIQRENEERFKGTIATEAQHIKDDHLRGNKAWHEQKIAHEYINDVIKKAANNAVEIGEIKKLQNNSAEEDKTYEADEESESINDKWENESTSSNEEVIGESDESFSPSDVEDNVDNDLGHNLDNNLDSDLVSESDNDLSSDLSDNIDSSAGNEMNCDVDANISDSVIDTPVDNDSDITVNMGDTYSDAARNESQLSHLVYIHYPGNFDRMIAANGFIRFYHSLFK